MHVPSVRNTAARRRRRHGWTKKKTNCGSGKSPSSLQRRRRPTCNVPDGPREIAPVLGELAAGQERHDQRDLGRSPEFIGRAVVQAQFVLPPRGRSLPSRSSPSPEKPPARSAPGGRREDPDPHAAPPRPAPTALAVSDRAMAVRCGGPKRTKRGDTMPPVPQAYGRHGSGARGSAADCSCWRPGVAVVRSAELGSGHNAPGGGLPLRAGILAAASDAAVGLHACRRRTTWP